MHLFAPGNSYFTRTYHFKDAVIFQKFDHRADLALFARHFDDETLQSHIHDLAVETLDDLHHLASGMRLRLDLDQGQITGDKVLVRQVDHFDDVDEFIE